MTERATAPRDAAVDEREGEADDERRDENPGNPGGTIARAERTAAARDADRSHDADRTTAVDRSRDAEAARGARAATPGEPAPEREAELFDRATAGDLERRWQAVQVRFVDEPREAVAAADKLVAEVLDQLTSSFANERRDLEAAWSGGRESSTEDLRQAIRRYRSFFNRLLAV